MACCFAWFTCLEGFSMFQANLLMFSTVSGEFDLEHCLQHSCFTYFYLFFTAFFGCSKPIHSRFRFAPWRVEAKSSSAWTALKYRSRSGLWPWSLREPRSWCAFQMHCGSQMMVLVLDWACHGAERSKMSTMSRRFLWGPQGFLANSPHLVQSCSRFWAEVWDQRMPSSKKGWIRCAPDFSWPSCLSHCKLCWSISMT